MEKKLQQQKTDCLRIVLYGPESTGKTTLAKALAEAYQTSWVPEFARNYLEEKWNKKREICNLEDLIIIAEGQIKNENEALKHARDFVFCDTNILVTKAWSETHFHGYCAPEIEYYVETFQYEHYFLTDIDVPWEADNLRDRPNNREEMFLYFKRILDKKKVPYHLIKGTHRQRMIQAKEILKRLIVKNDI